jgi:hypothetical protein
MGGGWLEGHVGAIIGATDALEIEVLDEPKRCSAAEAISATDGGGGHCILGNLHGRSAAGDIHAFG